MLTSDDLRLVGPDVIEVSARHERLDPHVKWWVDYAPEPATTLSGRVVFGTLHAFGAAGGAEVTVASVIKYPNGASPTSEEFEKALKDSDALETLYDYARTVVSSVAAIVNARPELDRKAPEPVFGQLKRASESDSASTSASAER